jgi:hypothetical protein
VQISDDAGRNATLEVRLDRQRGGTWRISEVTNVAGVIDDLRRSEQARVAKAVKELESMVAMTPPVLQPSDRHLQTFKVTFAARSGGSDEPAHKATWSATCGSGVAASSLAPEVVRFAGAQPVEASFQCACGVKPCQPAVRIESVKLRDGKTIHRAKPLPLD